MSARLVVQLLNYVHTWCRHDSRYAPFFEVLSPEFGRSALVQGLELTH